MAQTVKASTVKHAIQILQQAQGIQEEFPEYSGAMCLKLLNPDKPCAAFGLAKKAFFKDRNLNTAIRVLELQLNSMGVKG